MPCGAVLCPPPDSNDAWNDGSRGCVVWRRCSCCCDRLGEAQCRYLLLIVTCNCSLFLLSCRHVAAETMLSSLVTSLGFAATEDDRTSFLAATIGIRVVKRFVNFWKRRHYTIKASTRRLSIMGPSSTGAVDGQAQDAVAVDERTSASASDAMPPEAVVTQPPNSPTVQDSDLSCPPVAAVVVDSAPSGGVTESVSA